MALVAGVHYFKKLSREMPCELLYPVFLMYNQDGLLGAFGWLFQGSPHFYAYDDELSWFRLTESTYPVSKTFFSLCLVLFSCLTLSRTLDVHEVGQLLSRLGNFSSGLQAAVENYCSKEITLK